MSRDNRIELRLNDFQACYVLELLKDDLAHTDLDPAEALAASTLIERIETRQAYLRGRRDG